MAKRGLYLSIPEKTSNSNGDLRFSYDGGDYPKSDQKFPEKIVGLKTGDVVLFPSSLFHSTIPFHNSNRITLAFDVRPMDLELLADA